MPETATVLDLKTKLATTAFEDIPVDRQRLIYSGRVMKNEEKLSFYKIKEGNTVHMVKSAPSNAAQNPANAGASTGSPAAGVPTNMAAGTAVNNPLVGLTGARYAGHNINLPGLGAFGADGGVSFADLNRMTFLANYLYRWVHRRLKSRWQIYFQIQTLNKP